MYSSNDLNTVELCDDVDNLLFLCDRLHTRLSQVTSHVDEVRQSWTQKRHAIETDPNLSPIIAQKAARCNKILLYVAEKLALVELQTESLRNLQSSMTHLNASTPHKREASPSVSSLNHTSFSRPPSSVQMNHFKQDTIGSGFAPLRDLSSNTTRPLHDQRQGGTSQTPLHVSTRPPTEMIRARDPLAQFSDTTSVKSTVEKPRASPGSAFQRQTPLSTQEHLATQSLQPSSQGLASSRMSQYRVGQKLEENGPTTAVQKPVLQSMAPRPATQAKPFAAMSPRGSVVSDGKVRVKMQMVKPGTVWLNADIPITDHLSAFFVCNQEPRVVEPYHALSMEMNNFYDKSANTTGPLRNPAIGDFCVTRFSEDKRWYRARVVLIHNDESILIVFIDYGNSENKLATEIYPIQESFAQLPAAAVACTLSGAFPTDGGFWTSTETDILNNLVKSRIVEVHFQQGSEENWPLHFVQVILPDGQSITQHPQLTSYITAARNDEIARHYNDKLTSMEYILYNVAVSDSDIYTGDQA